MILITLLLLTECLHCSFRFFYSLDIVMGILRMIQEWHPVWIGYLRWWRIACDCFSGEGTKTCIASESCNTLNNNYLIYTFCVTGVLESRGCLLVATPDPRWFLMFKVISDLVIFWRTFITIILTSFIISHNFIYFSRLTIISLSFPFLVSILNSDAVASRKLVLCFCD